MTIKMVRYKDADYTVRLQNSNGDPVSIVGWTFIIAKHKKDGGGSVDISSPLDVGQDEVQSITYASVPTSGEFKINIGGEVTTALVYNASTTDIENAINALPKQADVTVAGDFTTGHVITFTGGSGKRNQPSIVIDDNSLVNGVNAVSATVAVVNSGSPQRGVDVVDDKCGLIKVYLSEEDTKLLAKGKNGDIDICVRVGARDLNIPPLRKVLEVEASPFE